MGVSCEKPACPYACHGNGYCKEGTCECKDMWGGEACEQRLYWCPKDCHGNGECVKVKGNGSTAPVHKCQCKKLPSKVVVPKTYKGKRPLAAMFEGKSIKGQPART